ncbi:MAG: glycosyltransferase family 4 protein [Pseudolabrys sp.]|nr:glycosyltransferase family 4 protein [Pseudolabrys sp.]
MPRIIFLNRFFYPDHSATSQILSDLAFHLAGAGHDIQVVTSRQRYDDPAADLPVRETVKGVTVHRVPTTRFGRAALIGRGLDYLSYHRASWRALGRLAGAGDILVAKTDPPLLSVLAMHAAARSGARLVNWLQDLYPEVAVELGLPLTKGPIAAALAHQRNRSLQAATANVVLGHTMAARVRALPVAAEKVHIIPNWSSDEDIVPIAAADNPLRREWGLAEKFVVGYSGNLGRAHDFETVLAAAERLRGHAHIVFVFIGGGRQFDEVARQVRERRLGQTVRFFPYQDHARLKYSLSVPDVHWLSLRPAFEGLMFPSKFYGIAAAGRPIVALADTGGEIAGLVARHGCGIAIDPADAGRLTQTLLALANDMPRCADMGLRARRMLEANFTQSRAFAQWRGLFDLLN